MDPSSYELPAIEYLILKENPYIEHISHMKYGAYASEWVARALGFKVASSNDTTEPTWHDYLRPVFPHTLIRLLKQRGLESYSYDVYSYSDEEKLRWIKTELHVKRKPLLLLIKTTTLHWIVVVGYNDEKQEFYVYDPNFGKNSYNKDVPVGNKEVNYTRLLTDWQGSYIFKYNSIIITTEPVTAIQSCNDNPEASTDFLNLS